MIRAILYDHDGTLVDSIPAVVAATNAALEQHGYAVASREQVMRGMVLPTAPRMGHHAGCQDPARTHRMAQDFYRVFFARAPELCRAYPGVAELLQRGRAAGLKQAVVSNNQGACIRMVMAKLGLAQSVDGIFGEEDLPATKPDPRAPLHAAQALGVRPAECLFVGDSGPDVQAARAAGMQALGVTWGIHPRAELEGLGFSALVDSVPELWPLIQRHMEIRASGASN